MFTALLIPLIVFSETVWVGLDPTLRASSKSSEASLASGSISSNMGATSIPSTFSIVVNDSSANADSIYVTYYSFPINTEGVVGAHGFIEVTDINDTSDATGHLFKAFGDSVMVLYAIKTGYIPYDTSTDFTLVSQAIVMDTSNGIYQRPINLKAATVGVDTLFKTWTWFEITVVDTTRWGELYSQDWIIAGSGLDDATMAGTYTGSGELGVYTYWFCRVGGTPDSISWVHTGNQGHTLSRGDSVAVTGAAQDLDSGMTINFAATTGHADYDSFMFVVSDSLHYGKQTDLKVRMVLDLVR